MAGCLWSDSVDRFDQLLAFLYQGQPITNRAWEEIDGITRRLRLIVRHAIGDCRRDLLIPRLANTVELLFRKLKPGGVSRVLAPLKKERVKACDQF